MPFWSANAKSKIRNYLAAYLFKGGSCTVGPDLENKPQMAHWLTFPSIWSTCTPDINFPTWAGKTSRKYSDLSFLVHWSPSGLVCSPVREKILVARFGSGLIVLAASGEDVLVLWVCLHVETCDRQADRPPTLHLCLYNFSLYNYNLVWL